MKCGRAASPRPPPFRTEPRARSVRTPYRAPASATAYPHTQTLRLDTPNCFDPAMNIAIIGGGPAGLRAAEIAATRGADVTLYDGMPSVGRKFLVAGRGGLNLTNVEPRERFIQRYSGPAKLWESLIADFDADALRAWAATLGVETFAASTGRVYPREMKAAPLLRR